MMKFFKGKIIGQRLFNTNYLYRQKVLHAMKRYCLTLGLKDDPALIAEYERYHQKIPDEIEKSIKESGIISMQIYRWHTRMCMIIEATDEFSFEQKAQIDATNPHVQAWEKLMWQFQQPLPQAKEGEKWLLMNEIFSI